MPQEILAKDTEAGTAPAVSAAKRKYWEYQHRLGKEYLIPMLREWGVLLRGAWVLDIGSGEGGVLCALAEEGARCTGLEVSVRRLQIGRALLPPRAAGKIHFVAGDFHAAPLRLRNGYPDLILLRDVFEHLKDKQRVIASLRSLMGPRTRLLITFPPFYSPFGGHQQMLRSFLRRVPYFHALPGPVWALFRRFIRHSDANAAFLEEMEKLRRHRITLGRFRKLLALHGLRAVHERYYLVRPSHKLRYGWPVLRAGGLGRIPILREVLISAAFFLVTEENP